MPTTSAKRLQPGDRVQMLRDKRVDLRVYAVTPFISRQAKNLVRVDFGSGLSWVGPSDQSMEVQDA